MRTPIFLDLRSTANTVARGTTVPGLSPQCVLGAKASVFSSLLAEHRLRTAHRHPVRPPPLDPAGRVPESSARPPLPVAGGMPVTREYGVPHETVDAPPVDQPAVRRLREGAGPLRGFHGTVRGHDQGQQVVGQSVALGIRAEFAPRAPAQGRYGAIHRFGSVAGQKLVVALHANRDHGECGSSRVGDSRSRPAPPQRSGARSRNRWPDLSAEPPRVSGPNGARS